MKIRRIYSKQGTSINDMSKDRVHLNMSWNEWNKIRNFIDLTNWELPKDSRLQKKAQNISISIKNAKELETIWLD